MAITEAYAAITGIGSTEWSLTTDTASPQTKTEDACVQVLLDLSSLQLGDKYRFRIYEKVRLTGTQRQIAQFIFANAQAKPIWASPTLILLHGWDVTMQKLAGVDHSIPFSVREMTQTGGGAAPTISSFTPLSGDAGDLVTITGTNFTSASGVKFGTTGASLVVVNDTTIQTNVPSGMTPGDYTITVDTFGNSVTSSTTFHVATFSGPVTLTSDYVVSSGLVEWDPYVTTTVTMDNKHFICEGGTVRMRPSAIGVVHTLRFINVDESLMVGGGTPVDAAGILSNPLWINDKGFWVVNAGVMDLQGTAKQTWTRATASIGASATTCDIPAGHNWQTGDEIVMVPTAPDTYTQYDERTLSSVTGNTLGFSATSFSHPAVTLPDATTLQPEILNTTNNVRLEGTSGHKVHWYIHSEVPVTHTIKNVSVRYMGPRRNGQRLLGRWPIHLHHSGTDVTGLVVENCTVRDSGSFAFVSHDTHDVTFLRCVGHNNQESQFWWDHDASTDVSNRITYDTCVASKTLTGDTGEGTSQGRLSAFYLDRNGTGHACNNCIAVGLDPAPNNPKEQSGYMWPETDATGSNPSDPGFPGSWIFNDNIAHNNGGDGVFTWENTGTSVHPPFNNLITYHNNRHGLTAGAYGFKVTVNNWRSYRDGWGTSLPGTLEPSNLRMNAMRYTHDHPILDGGGVADYCLVMREVASAGLPDYILILDPIFTNWQNNVMQWNNFIETPEHHTATVDIVRPKVGPTLRNMEAADLTFTDGKAGDRLRVQRQNNLTAWQFEMVTDTSFVITEIAPFYP